MHYKQDIPCRKFQNCLLPCSVKCCTSFAIHWKLKINCFKNLMKPSETFFKFSKNTWSTSHENFITAIAPKSVGDNCRIVSHWEMVVLNIVIRNILKYLWRYWPLSSSFAATCFVHIQRLNIPEFLSSPFMYYFRSWRKKPLKRYHLQST